eukprot:CAMPEP_0197849826 /NCGR_PEP_ID=MMETSP1438-20131217/13340_1 /TAXON_ID=1461541 /ORGANISM="Pterosperma sp., Strain CCMP1384" /LENGTH=61 /DNA_ID=CAMNT_0043462681 /DNA_START=37 /DNA_END=222 /DNA_ORIENTATION=-
MSEDLQASSRGDGAHASSWGDRTHASSWGGARCPRERATDPICDQYQQKKQGVHCTTSNAY